MHQHGPNDHHCDASSTILVIRWRGKSRVKSGTPVACGAFVWYVHSVKNITWNLPIIPLNEFDRSGFSQTCPSDLCDSNTAYKPDHTSFHSCIPKWTLAKRQNILHIIWYSSSFLLCFTINHWCNFNPPFGLNKFALCNRKQKLLESLLNTSVEPSVTDFNGSVTKVIMFHWATLGNRTYLSHYHPAGHQQWPQKTKTQRACSQTESPVEKRSQPLPTKSLITKPVAWPARLKTKQWTCRSPAQHPSAFPTSWHHCLYQ